MIASLSLILPVFNAERVLAARVHELLDLATDIHTPFEIWIYDDGSTDLTLEVAEGLTGEYPQIKIGHFERQLGWIKVVRQAILQARGELIMVCDSTYPISAADFAGLWGLRDDMELVLARSQSVGVGRTGAAADRLVQQMLQADTDRLPALSSLPTGITLIRRSSWLEIAPFRLNQEGSLPAAKSAIPVKGRREGVAKPPETTTVIERITRTDLRDRGVPAPVTIRTYGGVLTSVEQRDLPDSTAYHSTPYESNAYDSTPYDSTAYYG